MCWFLVLNIAVPCNHTPIFVSPPALSPSKMHLASERQGKRSMSKILSSLSSFTPTPHPHTEQRLCLAERIFCIRMSSAFKGVICFWCMQGAPSRRLCWLCAEASYIDWWYNGSIVGEWGHSPVTQVGDLEAHWMTKPHRWIPGYRMSLFKGKAVWWCFKEKTAKWNYMPLGERQSILISSEATQAFMGLLGLIFKSSFICTSLLSLLIKFQFSVKLPWQCIILSVWSSEQNT